MYRNLILLRTRLACIILNQEKIIHVLINCLLSIERIQFFFSIGSFSLDEGIIHTLLLNHLM